MLELFFLKEDVVFLERKEDVVFYFLILFAKTLFLYRLKAHRKDYFHLTTTKADLDDGKYTIVLQKSSS